MKKAKKKPRMSAAGLENRQKTSDSVGVREIRLLE